MSESKMPETFKHPNVEIAVKNFGPIAEATINLCPLTVFVGPSNTGKTYFSTLIYALHGIFNGFSRLPDRSRQIGDFDFHSLLHRDNTDRQAILKKFNTLDRSFKFADLPQATRVMLQSEIQDIESLKAELKRCFDLNSIRELIRLKDGQRGEMNIALKVSEEIQSLWHFNLDASESYLTTRGAFNKNLVLCPKELLESKEKFYLDDLYSLSFSKKLNKYTGDRAYLPAARSGIMQSHRVIASSLVKHATRGGLTPLEIPTFSGIVADFMQRLILYEEFDGLYKEINKEIFCLAETIESNVLAGQILMKPSASGYPEFLCCPKDIGEEVRLTRAASMVSELAPVVLFLRGGIRPGDMLIIEEPEAHLHPGAQTEIALTLAGLVRAGVRVVVTTHSDWLLKEIANLIRIGELKRKGVPETKKISSTQWLLPEEVGTWWFQKDGSVKQIPFDRTEGVEPKDYEDVAYELYDRSVNLQDLLEEVDRR
ncbi:MAG: AAA family ATPase [Candidatus Poribacteria bacterium]|nr:AAA family ATPase [Candidatus Poribacteria bacterium]